MAQGEMTAVVLGVMLAPGFGEEQECMPINRYRKLKKKKILYFYTKCIYCYNINQHM